MNKNQKAFIEFIKNSLHQDMPSHIQKATATLNNHLKNKKYALIIYGSSLNPVTQSKNSTPDYFVITSNLKLFHQSTLDYFLNQIFTPNIYHFQTDTKTFSKYSVSSLDQLKRESLSSAKDLFLMGRFSKRMLLEHNSDPEVVEILPKLIYNCMKTVAKKCLALQPSYQSLDEFCQAAIRLSYLGDTRVESADKFMKIFQAHAAYYQKCYGLILDEFNAENLMQRQGNQILSNVTHLLKKERRFLKRSKRRAIYRWPKAMFTARNWLDYVILKIERTQNIKIDMKPFEKKWWPIFIWKHAFKIWKRSLIK